MTESIRKTLFLFVLFPCCTLANPAYFGLHGGVVIQDDYTVESEDQDSNLRFSVTDISTEPGFRGGIAYGVLLETNRLEVELSYRDIGFEDAELSNGNGDSDAGSGGSLTSTSLMANFYTHFPLGKGDSSIYAVLLGIGGGLALLDVDDVDTSSAARRKSLSDSTSVFAYQLMLGVSMLRPGDDMGISFEYRMFLSEEADLEDSAGVDIVADGFSSHEFLISVQVYMD